ncbi:MAG: poly(3-hydroxybutyrate) depolymerase [Halomonadaceae bacterium]|nr:MAG: poly(3-hydroxybutyrate) depolymerase [Halomonadaceae bacterium]
MAAIDLHREHGMSREEALAGADRLAAELERNYDLKYEWDGNFLRFKRTGAKGWLKIEANVISIHLELGLFLRAFKGRIEQEVSKNLDEFIAGH